MECTNVACAGGEERQADCPYATRCVGFRRQATCWNCNSSTSLPAGEPFDDGSVCDYDRLVCVHSKGAPKVVAENENCQDHTSYEPI